MKAQTPPRAYHSLESTPFVRCSDLSLNSRSRSPSPTDHSNMRARRTPASLLLLLAFLMAVAVCPSLQQTPSKTKAKVVGVAPEAELLNGNDDLDPKGEEP